MRISAYFPYFDLWDHISVSVSVCVFQLLTFECLNQSLWNLVRMSCHLRPPQWGTSYIPLISNTNTTTSQICWCITLNITWMPGPIFTGFGMYIVLAKAISTVYCINHSHQYYQQCSLPNYIVLLASLLIHTKVLFLHIVSDTQITVEEK
jgi:hypothetical protein